MVDSTDILNASILIVDDQEAHVLLLERILRQAGYTCIASTTAPGEVCTMHRMNGYDLILLDLAMPGMDGFQVMDNLKAIERDGYLPVLAITAHPGHKLRALQGGAKDFVSKPFETAEVLARVHNMLEVRLLHESARYHGKMLESLSRIDPLTDLANRRLLGERMTMALAHARRRGTAMAVVYLDLDGFKQVNDAFGHPAGDLLLKMVAGRLASMVRKEDTLARMGGDEFIIVLTDVNRPESASTVAAKALEAVSRIYSIEGHSIRMTASAGIGIYPLHGEDASTLIKSADLALYEAKRAGGNVYRISERISRPEDPCIRSGSAAPAPPSSPGPHGANLGDDRTI